MGADHSEAETLGFSHNLEAQRSGVARWHLCGGPWVTGISTATSSPGDALMLGLSQAG